MITPEHSFILLLVLGIKNKIYKFSSWAGKYFAQAWELCFLHGKVMVGQHAQLKVDIQINPESVWVNLTHLESEVFKSLPA